jgi:hypothetical protein
MHNARRLLLSSVLACATQASLAITISDIVGEVAEGSYSNYHVHLYTSEGDSRGFSHNEGVREPAYQHDLARDYIASNFTAMGFDTWLDPFGFAYTNDIGTYTYTNCNNVVAVKPGAGGTNIYVIGAHYDTVDVGQTDAWVTNLCAGADDNGSGVAALLEIARVIRDYTFRDTIYLVAFDAEEKELAGSRHFANTHTTLVAAETNQTTVLRSRVKGMVSVDMIAFNLDDTPDQVIIGSPEFGVPVTGPISYSIERAVTNYTGMQPILMGVPGSDHNAFHDAGIDSALLIEGDFFDLSNPPSIGLRNPAMHNDSDYLELPGLISYRYATECTRCMVAYLCEQARVVPPATLRVQGVSDDKVEIFFYPATGISYSLYGTTNLAMPDAWEFIQPVQVTNPAVEVSVELGTQTAPGRMFRIIGE